MKLDAARRLALSLPEATEAPHFHYASFRVQGKIFATAPPDGEYLHLFVADDERDAASAVASAGQALAVAGLGAQGAEAPSEGLAMNAPGRPKRHTEVRSAELA